MAKLAVRFGVTTLAFILGEPKINTKALFGLIAIILLFLMTACGGSEKETGPTNTPPPAPSPTPRSTALPDVATPIIPGSDAQPITIGFVVTEVNADVQNAKRDLSTQIGGHLTDSQLELMGLSPSVEVEHYNSSLEALEAVCQKHGTLVWVNAFTYIAAEQACGAQPLFAVRKSSRESVDGLPTRATIRAISGLSFDLAYDTRFGVLENGLADVRGLKVCRLGADDPISWIYFALALRSVGINPVTDLAEIVDVEDYSAILLAIAEESGPCDVGAIPKGSFNALSDSLEDEINPDDNLVAIFGDNQISWPEVPYSILIAPPETLLSANLRGSVVEAWEALLADSSLELEDSLGVLLAYRSIEAVTASDFDAFRSWLAAAGWQMSH